MAYRQTRKGIVKANNKFIYLEAIFEATPSESEGGHFQ